MLWLLGAVTYLSSSDGAKQLADLHKRNPSDMVVLLTGSFQAQVSKTR